MSCFVWQWTWTSKGLPESSSVDVPIWTIVPVVMSRSMHSCCPFRRWTGPGSAGLEFLRTQPPLATPQDKETQEPQQKVIQNMSVVTNTGRRNEPVFLGQGCLCRGKGRYINAPCQSFAPPMKSLPECDLGALRTPHMWGALRMAEAIGQIPTFEPAPMSFSPTTRPGSWCPKPVGPSRTSL